MWGLKSQRGDGPWLCVEVDTGELVLLNEPLPVDARFFWGFTTVRKRVKLLGSHHRYLSAELNRSVSLFLSLSACLPSWSLPPPSTRLTPYGLALPIFSAGRRQPGASRAVGNVDRGAASLQQVDTSELSRVRSNTPYIWETHQGTDSDCVLGSLFAHVMFALPPLSYYLSGLNDGMVVANQGVPREAEQVR